MAKKHGHHGGAWKVAYADFVTAMMALFLVLWLTSQDEKIKEAVQRSFKNPFVSLTKESTGVVPNKDVQAVKSTEGNFDSASVVELNMLRTLASDLLKTLQSNAEVPQDDPVKLEMTNDGVRINLFDRSRHAIFNKGTADFTEYGKFIISTLAWQVARYTNNFIVEVEGHTEKRKVALADSSPDWAISTDRALAARKRLILHGVLSEQVRKVAGYADTRPLFETAPEDESNRRVAIMLRTANSKE